MNSSGSFERRKKRITNHRLLLAFSSNYTYIPVIAFKRLENVTSSRHGKTKPGGIKNERSRDCVNRTCILNQY